VQLGISIALDGAEVKQALDSDAYTQEVAHDIAEAQQLGIQGVPFFVLDRKYAVSGAQSAETFVQALEKAYSEFKQENGFANLSEGEVCTPGGDCN